MIEASQAERRVIQEGGERKVRFDGLDLTNWGEKRVNERLNFVLLVGTPIDEAKVDQSVLQPLPLVRFLKYITHHHHLLKEYFFPNSCSCLCVLWVKQTQRYKYI